MTIAFLFWLLMILWLLFGSWTYWADRRILGGHFLLWVLLFLLGWEVFGFPITR
jgi:hypothetical protein